MRWLRQAADRGNALAMNNLGFMYQNGLGVEQDYEEAVRWYRQGGGRRIRNGHE